MKDLLQATKNAEIDTLLFSKLINLFKFLPAGESF